MNEELVAVLDLGSTKAVCLAASADEKGEVKVESVATTPCSAMKKGVLVDPEEAARAIDLVVGRVEKDTGQTVHSMYVGFGGTQFECMNGQGLKIVIPKGRQVTNQDVLEVINHSQSLVLGADKEQMQVIPREFRVDGERNIQKPIGMPASKLEVFTCIVAGNVSAIQTYDRAVKNAGKKIEQLVLSPLASGIGVLTTEEMELGSLVIDIGGGTTSVSIFANGSLAYSAVIPAGSNYVTSDISQLLKTSQDEAERLKTTYGSAYADLIPDTERVDVRKDGQTTVRPMQRKVLCEIIESRMREIGKLVMHHVEKSGYYASLPGGVVLTGGGAQLANTDKLFQDQLKHLRVRVAEPDFGKKLGKQVGMATAAGLARYALQCREDLSPSSDGPMWRTKVRSLFSMISGR
ncbi:MAG: cell division protein FtsA [Fimbriimonas sp.]